MPEPGPLLARALASRPDLRAAELAVEAAGERAGLARWQILKLSGVLDANAQGKQGFEAGPGLVVELPFLDRGEGARARSAAELERAARHYLAVRERIALEVGQAHARCLQAREEFEAWRARILPALEEGLTRAEKAFQVGELPRQPFLEWRVRLAEGRLREADLAARFRLATVELERGVGARLESRPTPGEPEKE